MAASTVVVSASAAHESHRSASNRAAATSDAKTHISQLILPAGSTRLAGEPTGDHGVLGGTSVIGTPNLEDVAGWWRAPGTVESVIAFVKAHRPAGATVAATTGGGGPGYQWQGVTFQWPPRPGVLSTRWLVIEVAPLADGRTGVRADGESVWVTPRPSSERIPPADRVSITVTHFGHTAQGPIVIRAPRRVRRLRALLNHLPAAQPGVAHCPADRGVRIVLEFFAAPRGGTPVAQATVSVGGCGGVALELHGRQKPGLGDPRGDLVARIDSIIGRHLKTL